jgi:hypothetical protein
VTVAPRRRALLVVSLSPFLDARSRTGRPTRLKLAARVD